MKNTDGSILACSSDLAKGPVKRALLQTLAFLPDYMVEVYCAEDQKNRRRRLVSFSSSFVWFVYVDENLTKEIVRLTKTSNFATEIVQHIKTDKHLDVQNMDSIDQVTVVGQVVIENSPQQQQRISQQVKDEDEKDDNKNNDNDNVQNDQKMNSNGNNNNDKGQHGQLVTDEDEDGSEDAAKDDTNNARDTVVLVGAVAGIASLVSVLAFFAYKISRRSTSTQPPVMIVDGIVQSVSVRPTSDNFARPQIEVAEAEIEMSVAPIEWSKSIAERRPSNGWSQGDN